MSAIMTTEKALREAIARAYASAENIVKFLDPALVDAVVREILAINATVGEPVAKVADAPDAAPESVDEPAEKASEQIIGSDGKAFPQTFDAQAWAKAFNETLTALGDPQHDEGWLIGWFANAIMRGFDEAQSRTAPPSQPAQGWKLVPVEPTPEMFGAASTALHKLYLREGGWCGEKAAKEQALETWQAMLAAAPAAYATARPDDTIGSLERECSDLIDQVIQQRALIEGLAAMCRRMSYALKRQGANDTLVMQCVALLKKHDLGGNVVRAADTQPTAPAAPTQEPVLDKPASIGSTRFGKGVKVSTVIAAAQRLYEYQIRDEPDFAALMQAKPTNGEGA